MLACYSTSAGSTALGLSGALIGVVALQVGNGSHLRWQATVLSEAERDQAATTAATPVTAVAVVHRMIRSANITRHRRQGRTRGQHGGVAS